MAQKSYIKFGGNNRLPVERLALKLGILRHGEGAKPVSLPTTTLEAVIAYEQGIDAQLEAKGIDVVAIDNKLFRELEK